MSEQLRPLRQLFNAKVYQRTVHRISAENHDGKSAARGFQVRS